MPHHKAWKLIKPRESLLEKIRSQNLKIVAKFIELSNWAYFNSLFVKISNKVDEIEISSLFFNRSLGNSTQQSFFNW